jgi:16S rRNA (cytosine1402-N4)-methyltransferase
MPGSDSSFAHKPVMLREVISLLQPGKGGLFIDATLGLGGHSEAILQASPDSRVIGIDQDLEALKIAEKRLKGFDTRITFHKANFSHIREIVEKESNEAPAGILADLGVSSLQLDSESRGFSFRFDAPLDMRMDQNSENMTVAEFLATSSEKEIADTIYRFGEERASRRIARRIVHMREQGTPVQTTFELAQLVKRAVPHKPKDIHPATKTFQALRIAVNNELDILERFATDSVELLRNDGVLAVMSFHSLEDRIIKNAFQKLAGKCFCPPRIPQCVCGAVKKVEILTRKAIVATEEERNENPRSRSAKLRACRKLEQ